MDRDRKTVRAYVNGDRVPGVRAATAPDPLALFADYVGQRFADDPHVWATVLFDEVVELGFDRSYQSFTRLLRARDLGPPCEACSGGTGRATVESEHPAGEEIQSEWLELR